MIPFGDDPNSERTDGYVIASRSIDHLIPSICVPQQASRYVRASLYTAGYILKPAPLKGDEVQKTVDMSSTELTLVIHLDLNGILPAALVNYLVTYAPGMMVNRIRSCVRAPDVVRAVQLLRQNMVRSCAYVLDLHSKDIFLLFNSINLIICRIYPHQTTTINNILLIFVYTIRKLVNGSLLPRIYLMMRLLRPLLDLLAQGLVNDPSGLPYMLLLRQKTLRLLNQQKTPIPWLQKPYGHVKTSLWH